MTTICSSLLFHLYSSCSFSILFVCFNLIFSLLLCCTYCTFFQAKSWACLPTCLSVSPSACLPLALLLAGNISIIIGVCRLARHLIQREELAGVFPFFLKIDLASVIWHRIKTVPSATLARFCFLANLSESFLITKWFFDSSSSARMNFP